MRGVRLAGLEPAAFPLGGGRSILVSYKRFRESAPGRSRTRNQPGRNRLLYPLSYGGKLLLFSNDSIPHGSPPRHMTGLRNLHF